MPWIFPLRSMPVWPRTNTMFPARTAMARSLSISWPFQTVRVLNFLILVWAISLPKQFSCRGFHSGRMGLYRRVDAVRQAGALLHQVERPGKIERAIERREVIEVRCLREL